MERSPAPLHLLAKGSIADSRKERIIFHLVDEGKKLRAAGDLRERLTDINRDPVVYGMGITGGMFCKRLTISYPRVSS